MPERHQPKGNEFKANSEPIVTQIRYGEITRKNKKVEVFIAKLNPSFFAHSTGLTPVSFAHEKGMGTPPILETLLDQMLTVDEAAAILGRKPDIIRKRIVDGKLPATKRGNQYFISREEVEKSKLNPPKKGRPKKISSE